MESNGRILFQRFGFLIYIIGLVVYFVSPFDLIPEFVFGIIGFIDDVIVVIYGIVALSTVFYQFMRERNEAQIRAR